MLSTLAVACGKPVSIKFKPRVQSNNQAMQARTDLEVTQKETVTITRKKAMINYYDCHGNLTDRKLEGINGLSKRMKIKHEKLQDFFRLETKNPRTNQMTGTSDTHGHFTIDYSPTVFHLQVKEGINNIEYTFYGCSQVGKDERGFKTCVVPLTVLKEGIVQIDVIYNSEVVSEEQEVREPSSRCQGR